jgi:hypothetical protein
MHIIKPKEKINLLGGNKMIKNIAYKKTAQRLTKEIAEKGALGNQKDIRRILKDPIGEQEFNIPERESAYEIFYKELFKALNKEDRAILKSVRDDFTLAQDVSVLWEAFSYKEEARKKEEVNERIKEIEENLERLETESTRIENKKRKLQKELAKLQPDELSEKEMEEALTFESDDEIGEVVWGEKETKTA